MIKRIESIESFAVFQNFEWRESVIENGRPLDLKDINIIYGRNYSGKTTLSRILRAAEIGNISDKFENPKFKLTFSDGTEITEATLNGHEKNFRVFNQDFCRDNLRFISNPTESIESFAILGELNNEIEQKIRQFENEIGSNSEAEETGLYALKIAADKECQQAIDNLKSHQKILDDQLNRKATDKDGGIKYRSDRFGDQNYTRPKLDKDITTVTTGVFTGISAEDQLKAEQLIIENIKSILHPVKKLQLRIESISSNAQALVNKEVGQADKIEALIRNATLNRWVKDGKQLHKDKEEKCRFCDNDISNERWRALERHFDEESEMLEVQIAEAISEIEREEETIKKNMLVINENQFYSRYHTKLIRIKTAYNILATKYQQELNSLKKQLKSKSENLLTKVSFKPVFDYSKRIVLMYDIYNFLVGESNDYSNRLGRDQGIAKEKLRLQEVAAFIETIKYSDELAELSKLNDIYNNAKVKADEIHQKIRFNETQIKAFQAQLKDETKGAEKVNTYLNNFFGHKFLSLKAVQINSVGGDEKFKFEIVRNERKAHHLSEGEASLISFCYFIAKLDEINARSGAPIIWIDDPISSLDGNHIFFVYSMIKSEVIDRNRFSQLFISTHNLDFLKYLKRLTGRNSSNQNYNKSYLLIQRNDSTSDICVMPKYLRDFGTEFNYLFHQIYLCSKISVIDDTNYTVFYNFGNNARKFLEIYLSYKFPNGKEDGGGLKLQKFFGDEQIPTTLTERVTNEYSHLSAVFERGALPVEVPEMKLVADLIIKRIREIDEDQYNSLIESIGEPAPTSLSTSPIPLGQPVLQ